MKNHYLLRVFLKNLVLSLFIGVAVFFILQPNPEIPLITKFFLGGLCWLTPDLIFNWASFKDIRLKYPDIYVPDITMGFTLSILFITYFTYLMLLTTI